MSRRLTDSEKYKDAWFIELNPTEKLVFYYLIDNVDNAGFYEISLKYMKFHLDISSEEILGAIKGLGRGLLGADLEIKSGTKIYLKNFLKHQKNLPLNPFNSFHKQTLTILSGEFDFVQKYPFLSNLEVSGTNQKTGEKINEILINYIIKNQGLNSPLVKVKVEVNSKSNEKGGVGEKTKIEFQKIVDIFNSVCKNLPQVSKITKQREISINARLQEYGLSKIGEVFQNVSNSQFLNGANDRGWKADFDWVINPNNFIKILEGKYQQTTKITNQEPSRNFGTNRPTLVTT